ncbi:hypothetical protein [Streptomyces sp. NPDC059262]|uniref:hypothetical protein n=1 Tax=Streptomyces sp. NPDC059262 TaxID=3346797 RepID=UPI0036BF0008
MTSIERTEYPRFKRLITAHELHLFFAPAGASSLLLISAAVRASRSSQRPGKFVISETGSGTPFN